MRYNTKYYNRRTKNLFKSRKKNQQGKRKKGKTSKGRRKRKSASRKCRRSRVKKKNMIGGIPDDSFPNNIPTGSKVKFNDTATTPVTEREGWIMQRVFDPPQQKNYIVYNIRGMDTRLLRYDKVLPSNITELIYKYDDERREKEDVYESPPGNDYHINPPNKPTEENWWDDIYVDNQRVRATKWPWE